ncbi:MAG: ABC transporter substrate-binding protein [Streptococcaceae bacterium]|jgi:NitT/TauT family transport system substrate-binding protein|nr:ABC transporter substrate-binding protein [Streptococcaceae bacterium]
MKKLSLLIGTLASILLLSACTGNNNATTSDTSSLPETQDLPTLRIGMLPAENHIPFILADERGWDESNGVNLEIVNFSSPRERDAALAAGELDGVSTDLIAVSIAQQAGSNLRPVSSSHGNFVLMAADESIQSPADLKGKNVILASNAGPEYAVAMMLASAGLTLDDINVMEIPQVPARLELLQNGQADAAILPEPFGTIATAQALHEVSSTRTLGLNPFSIAFKDDVINENKEAILALFAAYNQAVDYLNENDQAEFIDLFIASVGYPEELKEKITIPKFTHIVQVKESDFNSVFAWSREKGIYSGEQSFFDIISNNVFD